MTWAVIGLDVLFASVIATALLFYALAFKANGGELTVTSVFHIVTHPFFLGGLALALSSSLMRLALFDMLGFTRTALVTQLAVVFSVTLLWVVFREGLSPWQIVGGVLVLGGVFLVAR